jgi:hypothetical protein
MKKSILSVGSALSKTEQRGINGGSSTCYSQTQCESMGCPYECVEFRIETGLMKWKSCWVCQDPNNYQ